MDIKFVLCNKSILHWNCWNLANLVCSHCSPPPHIPWFEFALHDCKGKLRHQSSSQALLNSTSSNSFIITSLTDGTSAVSAVSSGRPTGIRWFQFYFLPSVPTRSCETAQRRSVAIPACARLQKKFKFLDLLSWLCSEVFPPCFWSNWKTIFPAVHLSRWSDPCFHNWMSVLSCGRKKKKDTETTAWQHCVNEKGKRSKF